MERPELSASQQKYLLWIAKVIKETGESPTLTEVGAHFKTSAVNAYKIVQILVRKGYIRKTSSGPYRDLEVLDEDGNPLRPSELPVIGRVAAGLPLLATENRVGYVTVDDEFVQRGASFLLTVQGKSMIGAGIFPGDKLIVRLQKTAERGEIVIARFDNEVTVKYFYSVKKDIVTLKAANPEHPDIIKPASECSIEGKVIGIIRSYADN